MFFVCLSRFVRGLDKIAERPLKGYSSQTQYGYEKNAEFEVNIKTAEKLAKRFMGCY